MPTARETALSLTDDGTTSYFIVPTMRLRWKRPADPVAQIMDVTPTLQQWHEWRPTGRGDVPQPGGEWVDVPTEEE